MVRWCGCTFYYVCIGVCVCVCVVQCTTHTHTHTHTNTDLIKFCLLRDNVAKYCTSGQATDDNMGHTHCLLDTEGYAYILRLCNSYCFSTAKNVGRTRLMLRHMYIGSLLFIFIFFFRHEFQKSIKLPQLKRYI